MFTTSPTLLAGIKKGDNVSWYRFRDLYRPLIFYCAEQMGVPTSDFLELEQNVLVTFFKACETFEYNPEKGKFRTYFGTLVRNCIAQLRRDRQKDNRVLSDDWGELSESEFEQLWVKEWEQHLFWLAMQRAKAELPSKMIGIFELCDLKGVAPCIAASALNISLASVYNYRRKTIDALKKYIGELQNMEENEK